MALITCPECGREVSDKAEICPHCGIKIAGNTDIINIQKNANATHVIHPQQSTASPITPATPPTGQTIRTNSKGADGKSKKILIASFVIALMIVGTGYYFYNDSQQAKEQEDYEYAMQSTDLMVLQSYLTRYSDAPQAHRDSINMRMESLSQEDTDWMNAITSGTKSALEEYLRTHPASTHRGEVANKIDSIDFTIASRGNSIAAYTQYLQQHPDGKYAGQAQDFIDTKKQTEVTPDEETMAKGGFRKFFQAINAHDEGKLLENVADGLSNFLNKHNATGNDVVTFMNKLYKEDVKNLNWHIQDGTIIEKVKNDDGTYSLKVQFPAELKMERTDQTKEKYAKFIVNGEMTPDGKITKLTMKKVENQN